MDCLLTIKQRYPLFVSYFAWCVGVLAMELELSLGTASGRATVGGSSLMIKLLKAPRTPHAPSVPGYFSFVFGMGILIDL